MVIGIIGENCAGKSTVADTLAQLINAEVITGKDWLRLAKSESEAASLFREKLAAAMTGAHIIYVISVSEHFAFLPQGAVRVLVSASLETIKTRFSARMRGNLPKPVADMLERKHGIFDNEPCSIRVDTTDADLDALCDKILTI